MQTTMLRFWQKGKKHKNVDVEKGKAVDDKEPEKEKDNDNDKKKTPARELGIMAEFNEVAEKCREKVKKIAAECHKHNHKYRRVLLYFQRNFSTYWTNCLFRDRDFDLICDQWLCLHNVERTDNFDPDDVRRVSDIFAYPKFFDNGATASDIVQGALGDCWFLSALGTVAAAGMIPRVCVEVSPLRHNVNRLRIVKSSWSPPLSA